MRGKRLSEQNVPEKIDSTLIRKVKISSDLVLSSGGKYSTGPFQNTGPIPPRAEEETTYTIVWYVNNSSNQVSNVQVTASLPSYVEWMGTVSPANEEVMFNPVGGLITWNLEEVSPGTGTVLPRREIAFQVKILPSLSQLGRSPVLVNEQTITGFDRFVEREISSVVGAITTRISEPGFNPNTDSTVQ